MLTYPSNYESALQSPFEENWLFQLHSDSTGSNFIGLAFSDTTVSSVFYYGAVLNKPSIRESIDLQKSVAKTTNLSITIPNFNYNGSDISTQLLNTGGATHYLNQPVKIYSQLNEATALGDCLQVFNGRLRYISMSGDKIQIQIVSERPWDNIQIPNIRSTTGAYVPVAYGDYTSNGVSGLSTSKSLYPAPFTSSEDNALNFLTAKSYSSGDIANFYDSNSDMFVYLAQGTTTVTKDGKDAISINNSITRTYRFRGTETDSTNAWTNPDRAWDSSKTNYADKTVQTLTNSSTAVTSSLVLNFPQISGKITAATLYIKADLTYTEETSGVEGTVYLKDDSFGTNATILSQTNSNATVSTSGSPDSDGNGSDYTAMLWTTAIANNNDQLPNNIKIDVVAQAVDDGVGADLDATGKVYDIYLQITAATDPGDEPLASAKETQDLETVYIGQDGLTKTWSSGTITKIHDAHRDLINRFTEFGVDSGSYTAPENWSSGLDIDSARTDWPVRFWVNEPTPLRNVLEKLQYEGGFIARFRSNGSLQYIVVPSSPSATDTLTANDIKNLKVSHVPFDEIITKMHIQWNKHPAKNSYVDDVTLTNGGNNTKRTRLNITKDLEGVSEVKLDAYADTSSAQRWFDYYDGLIGDLYIKISGEIVNPLLYKLEVGDQIAIDSSYPYAPFGEAWSGKVFMITSTSRMAHSMKFEARQIN
tara:strand:+ start:5138 stop:7252 length:2115 start_codon:yes stop_codon:yes gene_type:complete